MLNIPNLLTALRIILIPVFIIVYYLPVEWAYFAAAMIFSLAAITDWLDGYLARRLEQSTPFGAFLDPVADKIMVASALVLIAESYGTFWVSIPAMIMIGREILISALREWMAELGKRGNVAVNNLGKWKTTFQMTALIALIWQGQAWMLYLGFFALYGAAILTLWSMVNYLLAAWPFLSPKKSSD